MSHDDFILGYQNGRLGCSVSTLLTLRLFLVGRIRETRIVTRLVGWSLSLLLLIGLATIGFLCLPALWAFLATIILLAIFALGFVHHVAGLIVSIALVNAHFYQFVVAERALCVSTDSEGNMPKLQKVVPLSAPRRAQR
jgi:fatty acid desaturase